MKPILFSTPMVQAILAGRKTQTRRVVKPQPSSEQQLHARYSDGVIEFKEVGQEDLLFYYALMTVAKPLYQPGDILYVRETWGVGTRPDPMCGWIDGIEYRADESLLIDKYDDLPLYPFPDIDLSIYEGRGWRPSIHMPREVARIFLRVTDVRVEQLQEITAEDCIAEGVEKEALEVGDEFTSGIFHGIWDTSSAKYGYGWDTNPWVFVYSFERITKEEAEWDIHEQ